MFLFGPFIPIVSLVLLTLAITLVVTSLSQDAKQVGRPRAARNAFFVLLSFVSLATLTAVVTWLANIGLKATAFPDAYYSSYGYTPPPVLYMSPAPGETEHNGLECTEETIECPYNTNQITEIDTWASEYRKWKEGYDGSGLDREGLINALSIIIVGLPLFIGFFIVTRKIFAQYNGKSATKHVYHYGIALTALLVAVISLGVLINAGLKQTILPDSKNDRVYIQSASGFERGAINRIIGCQELCGYNEAYKALAREWEDDYKMVIGRKEQANPYHEDYALGVPLLVFGGALFAWHFMAIRREKNGEE